MANEIVRVAVRTSNPDVITLTEPIEVAHRSVIVDGVARLTLPDGAEQTIERAVGYYIGPRPA